MKVSPCIKKSLTVLAFFIVYGLGSFSNLYAQSCRGKVVVSTTSRPIPGALVSIDGLNEAVRTDAGGSFLFELVPPGVRTITVNADSFGSYEASITIEETGTTDLGSIPLTFIGENMTVDDMLVVELDLDEEASQSQSVNALLSSSDDAFLRLTGYNLNTFRFRQRGYDNKYSSMYMNGLQMNDVETGQPVWSLWGGLNDATRNQESKDGISPAAFSFGALSGVSNINTRASAYRKQVKVSYAASNKQYTNRFIVNYATGVMDNGWALAVSASRRSADEGYVDATFYDAWAYFLAAEKKFGKRHSIWFTTFGSPISRGVQNGSTQEVYDLVGNNLYNSNWGWQDGRKRNSRVRNTHQPVLMLGYNWDINELSSLSLSLGYSFGYNGTEALTWGEANDPRPDYYRNLPSYYASPEIKEQITNEWRTNPSVNQVNWNELYQVNRENINADGTYRAHYIIEDRWSNRNLLTGNVTYNSQLTDILRVNIGLDGQKYKGKFFKEVNDLLGGTYWLDIDKFAERDFPDDPDSYQNDLNNPNKKAVKGDKFGYDYDIYQDKINLWSIWQLSFNKLELYFANELTTTTYWRDGNMKNGKFPNNSYGKSEKHNFGTYGFKAGGVVRLGGRNSISANAAYLTQAPLFKDAYVSPRTRDDVVTRLTNEQIVSADLSYLLNTPRIKARLTGYYTQINDRIRNRSFYDDTQNTFVNMMLSNLDERHIGMEFGLEAKLTKTISFRTAFAHGKNTYSSRPLATLSKDNTNELTLVDEEVYMKDFYIPGTPQTVVSSELSYNSPNYWWVSVSGNYAANNYLEVMPTRRTKVAFESIDVPDEMIKEFTKQERFTDAFTMNISGGISFKIKDSFIGLNASIENIFNKKDIKTGGFEQMRNIRADNPDLFAAKYFYAYGRTFFIMLSYRF